MVVSNFHRPNSRKAMRLISIFKGIINIVKLFYIVLGTSYYTDHIAYRLLSDPGILLFCMFIRMSMNK